MAIQLIGVIYKTEPIGYRLLNTETREVRDVDKETLFNVIKQGRLEVKGLEIKGNDLVGTNGSLNRYPRIELVNNNYSLMKNQVIILNECVDDKGNIIAYTVCNGNGAIDTLNIDYLIQHIKLYGIANGLIRELNGKVIIQPINGTYEQIKQSEIRNEYQDFKYMYNFQYNALIVKLPDYKVNGIFIPNKINGIFIDKLMYLQIQPASRIKEIESIIVDKGINYLHNSIFEDFTRLRKLALLGTLKDKDLLYSKQLRGMLEELYIERLEENREAYLFARYTKLKRITFGVKPQRMSYAMFYWSSNLENIQDLVSDGLLSIEDYAFRRCNKLPQHLDLPESLRELNLSAFEECSVKSIRIKSIHTAIIAQRADLKNLTIYMPAEFPKELITQIEAKTNAKVIVEGTYDKRSIEKAATKYALLGGSVTIDKLVKDKHEFIGALSIIPNNIVAESILEYIKTIKFNSTSLRDTPIQITHKGVGLKLKLKGKESQKSVSSIGFKLTNNYICVAINNSRLYTVPISKQLMIESVKNSNNDHIGAEFVGTLNYHVYKIKINDIYNIIDSGDNLLVTLKDGKTLRLSGGEIK